MPQQHDTNNNPLAALSILVVDDNFHMLKIIGTILRGFGISKIAEVKSAEEAFSTLRQTHVDIIIVDYVMEMLDGIEFINLVRNGKDSPNPMIPIIMLTAYSERKRIIEARDSGVTEFCCKPVTARELFLKVRCVVANPRQFVRADKYFGPDRRRARDKEYNDAEKRTESISNSAIDDMFD